MKRQENPHPIKELQVLIRELHSLLKEAKLSKLQMYVLKGELARLEVDLDSLLNV